MSGRRRGQRSSGERGSGTLLAVAVVIVAGLAALVLLVVSGYVAAVHRARGVADLVAVSGALAVDQGREACPVARKASRRNGVKLISCRVSGDSLDYVVSVEIALQVESPSGLPKRVRAAAHAGRFG